MLYVSIDQHGRRLTICTRDEPGNIILRRQVSTGWERIDQFLESLRSRSDDHGGYVAMVEICGFNGWLIERLEQWGCKRTYVIKAPDRVRQKTDRRDAAKLSELLWINRLRTLPKIGEYTALALSARIGSIKRFEHARSRRSAA